MQFPDFFSAAPPYFLPFLADAAAPRFTFWYKKLMYVLSNNLIKSQ
jgi:hypothetical protein